MPDTLGVLVDFITPTCADAAPCGSSKDAISLKGSADALYASPEMLEKEIGSRYSGKFVIGRDLDVY